MRSNSLMHLFFRSTMNKGTLPLLCSAVSLGMNSMAQAQGTVDMSSIRWGFQGAENSTDAAVWLSGYLLLSAQEHQALLGLFPEKCRGHRCGM